MSTIRMETENVRRLVSLMQMSANSFRDSTSQLNSSIFNLDWSGVAKDDFEVDYYSINKSVDSLISQLEELATLLDAEIVQWEEVAAIFGSMSFAAMGIGFSLDIPPGGFPSTIPTLPFPIMPSEGDSVWGYDPRLPYDPFSPRAPYDPSEMDEWGLKTGEWLGDMAEKFDMPMGEYGFFKDGKTWAALGWANDVLMHGEPPIESAFESAISYGVSEGIEAGLKLAIPGVGAALLISGGVQVFGDVAAWGLNAAGYGEEAAIMQDALDFIDLGGHIDNVSDALAEGIVDFAQNPVETTQNAIDAVENVGEAIGDFAAGLGWGW